MANAILTGIIDMNGEAIYTGQIVKMHYFYLGLGDGGGVIECENEVIGKVRVSGYQHKQRKFCVETENGDRYPFSLMQEPSEEIEVIQDYQYSKKK